MTLNLPTTTPKWTTILEGKSCGDMSFFKLEGVKAIKNYNDYISENIVEVSNAISIVNNTLSIETSNTKLGAVYEL